MERFLNGALCNSFVLITCLHFMRASGIRSCRPRSFSRNESRSNFCLTRRVNTVRGGSAGLYRHLSTPTAFHSCPFLSHLRSRRKKEARKFGFEFSFETNQSSYGTCVLHISLVVIGLIMSTSPADGSLYPKDVKHIHSSPGPD